MPDASQRQAVPEDAVLRESADDGLAHAGRVRSEPQACATVDAADGHRGDLSSTEDDGDRVGTPEIPVSAAGSRDHTAGRRVGGGHHVHPDGAWLCVSRCRAGLGDRRLLSWRLSITMEAAFCVETLEDALARHGKPEIFNTDQGSQFTGAAFTGVLADNGVAISMDGRGAWRDNVFVERLWRSVKYEEVYLRGYDSVSEARASIGRYLDFYNGRRPHSSLDGATPDQAYFTTLPLRLAA